jgi:hypothetical protein
MKDQSIPAILEAVTHHPDIVHAAVTGSQARPGGVDEHSDLDLLLVARDLAAVRNVRAWLPPQLNILLCEFHLTRYCTVLLHDFEKIDLAIFSLAEIADSPSAWIVTEYRILKGDAEFESHLAAAVANSREKNAAHLHPDVSLDNVLLLLATASGRARRGEQLSAHAFLTMAADMVVSLEKRQTGGVPGADPLDPRRRLENTNEDLAHVLHQCLFVPPDRGIRHLAGYVSERHRTKMSDPQIRVLSRLLA